MVGEELEISCLVARVRFKRGLEQNLGFRLEKRRGFGLLNLETVGEAREHLVADRAPLGAWLSTSISSFFASFHFCAQVWCFILTCPQAHLLRRNFPFFFYL